MASKYSLAELLGRPQRARRFRLAVWAVLVRHAEVGRPWVFMNDVWREVGGRNGRVYEELARLVATGEAISRHYEETSGQRRRVYAVSDCLSRAQFRDSD